MRRAKITILISIIAIGLFVFVSFWVNLRERKASEEKEKVPTISNEGADAHMEKIRFVEDKHGKKTWELEARSIQQYQDRNMMTLEEVKVVFYAKEGRSFTLSGDRGEVHQDTKNMELVGNVILTSNDGYRLKTHSISYHHLKKRATTSDPVEIEGEQIRLVGVGMLVDLEAKTFKILHQVKTQWRGGGRG